MCISVKQAKFVVPRRIYAHTDSRWIAIALQSTQAAESVYIWGLAVHVEEERMGGESEESGEAGLSNRFEPGARWLRTSFILFHSCTLSFSYRRWVFCTTRATVFLLPTDVTLGVEIHETRKRKRRTVCIVSATRGLITVYTRRNFFDCTTPDREDLSSNGLNEVSLTLRARIQAKCTRPPSGTCPSGRELSLENRRSIYHDTGKQVITLFLFYHYREYSVNTGWVEFGES